jgi:hypothetical protein
LIEDVLSAVAVMNVPIDNQNALGAVLTLGVPGGYRDIVEEAKAHAHSR